MFVGEMFLSPLLSYKIRGYKISALLQPRESSLLLPTDQPKPRRLISQQTDCVYNGFSAEQPSTNQIAMHPAQKNDCFCISRSPIIIGKVIFRFTIILHILKQYQSNNSYLAYQLLILIYIKNRSKFNRFHISTYFVNTYTLFY